METPAAIKRLVNEVLIELLANPPAELAAALTARINQVVGEELGEAIRIVPVTRSPDSAPMLES